jgi:hypothetical protein
MNALIRFFAVIGLLFFATPWVAAAGAALMAVLHVWFDFSWWWMAIPGSLFVAWAAFMIWARKGVV